MTVRDRLHEVLAWLVEEFPVSTRVRLRVERMPKEFADCEGMVWLERPPLIRIRKGMSRSTSVYTLLHEYAHVLVADRAGWRETGAHDHSDAFYRLLGRTERAFADRGPTHG